MKNAGNNPSIICFFHEYEDYGCFSNWYPAKFDYAGWHFANSEQFIMFQKVMMFQRSDLAHQIMMAEDPAKCKKIAAQKFPQFDSALWEKTCHTVVKRGVKAKFTQNEEIREILLRTGNALLTECSPYDKKWGIGIDINDPDRLVVAKWKGKNLLGRILMEVREELRQELQASWNGKLEYVDAKYHLDTFQEWEMTAGELKRIPQFYSAIHAYSDTLKGFHKKDDFYHSRSLHDWEMALKDNMAELPREGFYEMKQDVYDTARRLKMYFASEE